MTLQAKYIDLGIIKYKDAWDYQESLQTERIKNKLAGSSDEEVIIFCEHPHVYTLGKSGDETNLLLDYLQLAAKNVEFFRTNRGGDITYHGPGQIVGYPIFDLDKFNIGIKKYIYNLEESIIGCLAEFGIASERLAGATGVWLDVGNPQKVRKIAAIGVKISRGISMHGFAFNISTDLTYFNHINPCGFTDKAVTSLSKELGREVHLEEVKPILLKSILDIYGLKR